MNSNRGLKNRVAFSNAIKIEINEEFNRLSDETKIPKSKLLDEAIEDLLKKYEKKGLFTRW